MTVLAGDIGGTNTRLAIYDVPASGLRGLKPTFEQTYPSAAHAGAGRDRGAIPDRCDREARRPRRGRERLLRHRRADREQHLPRHQPALGRQRQRAVGSGSASRASSWSTTSRPPRWASPRVGPDELVTLGGDPPVANGPIAVLGAGTGLGQAFLLWSATENRYRVVPSEGGHVDLRGAHAAGARPGPLPDPQIRPRVVRARAVRQGAGRRVHVPVRGAGLPRADQARDRRRAGDPRDRGAIPPPPSRSARWPAPIRCARWRWPSSAPCWARPPETWR